MARIIFFTVCIVGFAGVGVAGFFWTPAVWVLVILVPYAAIGLYDVTLAPHNVLHIYPVIGHLRYALEFISPEVRQYFVETNLSGRPFDRLQRNLVYARADGADDTQPFGTQRDIMETGFEHANHSLRPRTIHEEDSRLVVGGPDCTQPYLASRLNISAMSFGSLSPTAIHALNAGAKLGNFAHNTGEGGLSPYHLAGGGDIVWEIGTGYFGCRTKDGGFDQALFAENARRPVVKMIELKLSQGAKPSHGGVLPAAKVSAEIARIRGIEAGKDCISPPAHSTFETPRGLLEFVTTLRELSGGKPTGFKLCIGRRSEFMGICKAMIETGIIPDFITVDGAEGGTGAAPVEFSNRLGTPINEAVIFVNNCLEGVGLRDSIRVIASGKVVTGFDMVTKIALGADLCNSARTMMFALGCIQALRCNTNTCPSGVATQDPTRAAAIKPEAKKHKIASYQKRTVTSFLELVGAMGLEHPNDLEPTHIFRRVADETEQSYAELYEFLERGQLLSGEIPSNYRRDWERARVGAF